MKVLMINVVCGIRSTGRICTDLAKALEEQGHEVKIAYGRENVPEQFQKYAVKIGTDLDVKLHGMKARLLDGAGFGSKKSTEKFIEWVKEYDPDVIHLHNIHGYYINVEVLFKYLKNCGKKVIWTLHDCWSFTGHCCYYSMAECLKWKTGCCNCSMTSSYPESWVDRSLHNFNRKKEIFTCIDEIQLVTPSEWLKKEVKSSFLSKYSVQVIPNGIDTVAFSPKTNNFKEMHCISDKIMILGVASTWEKRKGLDDFVKLRSILSDKYAIVIVGLSKEQISKIPNGIIALQGTNSISQLAEIYTAADVFLNLSIEETMGLTTIEAMACDTPSIVYNATALPEVINEYSGEVVSPNNMEELVKAIEKIVKMREDYTPTMQAQKYKKDERFNDYVELYRKLAQV